MATTSDVMTATDVTAKKTRELWLRTDKFRTDKDGTKGTKRLTHEG